MNAYLKRIGCLWLTAFCLQAHAAFWETLTFSFDQNPLVIPDGDPNGTSDTRTLLTSFPAFQDLRVTLSLSGTSEPAFNGNLYVTLTHGDGFSVLLNRVGRRSDDSFGYSDNGYANVTFNDAAPSGDVHVYRLAATGSHNLPLGGPLTGSWKPDGRTTDPDVVLDSDARPALLYSLTNEPPSGQWTLFLADLSSGGQSQLTSWSLHLNMTPEPNSAGLLALGITSLVLFARRRRRDGV